MLTVINYVIKTAENTHPIGPLLGRSQVFLVAAQVSHIPCSHSESIPPAAKDHCEPGWIHAQVRPLQVNQTSHGKQYSKTETTLGEEQMFLWLFSSKPEKENILSLSRKSVARAGFSPACSLHLYRTHYLCMLTGHSAHFLSLPDSFQGSLPTLATLAFLKTF